jgi:hypothetical protein
MPYRDRHWDQGGYLLREHAARVLCAIQAVAVFVVMFEALSWRDDRQEGLWYHLRERGLDGL